MPLVRLEAHDRLAVVTLDRPPANAMDHELLAELNDVARRIEQDASIAAVVVTGTGKFFSAGLDLFAVLSYAEDESADAFANTFDDAMARWFTLPCPVVAAINGHAIAGGAVLAAAADFRLVADGPAKLGLTEILVGVAFPSSALEMVRFACAGPHLAELLYRGRTYEPKDAVAVRLADEVVPASELGDRAGRVARELGAHPRVAFLSTKRRLRAEHVARMSAARASGLDPAWREWRTPETRAAIEGFRTRTVGKK